MHSPPSASATERAFARSPRHAAICVAAALVLCAIAGAAPAALYKWTDANGRVVYSDQPPPVSANVKAELLSPPPPSANPHAVKEMANKDAELKKRQLDRAEEAKKADKSRVDADRKAESCTQLRGQIRLLGGDDVVYRANEKGERVYMDDAAKRKERERLEGIVRENNCPPA